MKKIFLSLVFLFGVGTFVMADDTMKVKNDTVAVEDGFKNIDLKEVPQSVNKTFNSILPVKLLCSRSRFSRSRLYINKNTIFNPFLGYIYYSICLHPFFFQRKRSTFKS